MFNYIYICIVKHNKQNTMKITEFAKKVGVHPLTVRRWIKEGRINATLVKIKGFAQRFDIDESEIKKVKKDDATS